VSIPIRFKRGSSAALSGVNPLFESGELVYETDTLKLKIGDGETLYNNLPIVFSGVYLQNIIDDNSPHLGNNLDINSYNILGTGNIDISGNLSAVTGILDRLVFNTGLDDPNLLAGELQWNSTEGTLDLGLNENYTMHLGEELLYRVRNTTGSTLLAGQPVYASGLSPGSNNRIEVATYVADGTIREIRFMGLMTDDLTDNGNNGFATQFGYIRGVDTRGNASVYGTTNKLWASGEPAWSDGDILYVHPTVPGKLTKIEPKHSISVAIITSVGSNGKMFVRPTSYGHLSDNHDVNVSGVINGQLLRYVSASDIWTTGIIYDNGDRVGIGTNAPTSSLHIRNSNNTSLQIQSLSGIASLDIKHNNSGLYGYIGFNNNDNKYSFIQHNGSATTSYGGPNALSIYNYAGPVILGASASNTYEQNVVINTDGNVGIGTNAPEVKLHVYSTENITSTRIEGAVRAGLTLKGNNTGIFPNDVGNLSYSNAANVRVGNIYATADNASATANGAMYFRTANSGNLAVRMSITKDGYVGIGTSSPSAQLHVIGSGIFSSGIDVGDGSASVPSMGFTNDINTGLYRIADDTVGISTSGIERLRIDSDGNVGIGSATPTARLNVEGGNVVFNDLGGNFDFRVEGDADPNLLFVDASNDTVNIGTGTSTGNKFLVSANNSRSYQHILASGGVATESSLMRVNNTSNVTSDSFAGVSMSVTRSGSSVGQTAVISAVATNAALYQPHIVFSARNDGSTFAELMRINHVGNVGIGTSTPSYKLDVVGSGNFSANVLVNGTPVSVSGHSHTSANISDFNTSVSGLLPVKNIIAGTDITVSNTSGVFTINSTAAGGGGSTADIIHPFLLGGM
jgi:hypothetical protein